MKTIKVEEFDTSKIPYAQTYILKIKHDYPITQYFRTAENLKNKLLDYGNFEIINQEIIKKDKTYILEIKGKLPKETRTKIIKIN